MCLVWHQKEKLKEEKEKKKEGENYKETVIGTLVCRDVSALTMELMTDFMPCLGCYELSPSSHAWMAPLQIPNGDERTSLRLII